MTTITTPTPVILNLTPAPPLPDEVVANARELNDLRDIEKAVEKRKEVLRAALLAHLDSVGQDAVTDGTVTVSRSHSTRKGVDRARLEALYPGVLADVSTSTPVTQVRVKVKG